MIRLILRRSGPGQGPVGRHLRRRLRHPHGRPDRQGRDRCCSPDVSGRGQRQPICVVHIGSDEKGRLVCCRPSRRRRRGLLRDLEPESELFEESAADPARRDKSSASAAATSPGAPTNRTGPTGPELEAFPWEIDKDERPIIDLDPISRGRRPPPSPPAATDARASDSEVRKATKWPLRTRISASRRRSRWSRRILWVPVRGSSSTTTIRRGAQRAIHPFDQLTSSSGVTVAPSRRRTAATGTWPSLSVVDPDHPRLDHVGVLLRSASTSTGTPSSRRPLDHVRGTP